MLSIEELELVSRYLEGELTGAELQGFETRLASDPTWQSALERMRLMNQAAATLPDSLSGTQLSQFIAQVQLPARPKWGVWALVVAVMLLTSGAWWRASTEPVAALTVVAGPIFLNQHEVALGAHPTLAAGDRLDTQRGAAIVSTTHATWFIPENAAVTWQSVPQLRGGTAMVLGDGPLQVGANHVELHGTGVFSMEPDTGLIRVTTTLATLPREAVMRADWLKLGAYGAVMAGLGGASVYLLEGKAQVATPVGAVEVNAGSHWSNGRVDPLPDRASVITPAAKREESRPSLLAEAELAKVKSELAEAQQKLALHELVSKGLHPPVDADQPQPWPATMPENMQPDGFARVMNEVKAKCPKVPALLETKCEEPPCVISFNNNDALGALRECEVWNKAFGDTVSMSTGDQTCFDGGTPTPLTLLSPHWSGWDDEEPAYSKAVSKRLQMRWQHYTEAFCAKQPR